MGTEITKAIPPSADAAALGKFGSVPVSYFTGVPDISIPLYTIKSGDLSLPIGLSYHSGGIKVEEQASSVGLGWALNAGGMITRTLRGIADEDLNGYLDPAQYVKNVNNALLGQTSTMTYENAGKMLNHFVDGTYDGEADLFNFNFGGYSGQFSFTENGTVMVSPQQAIKFEISYSQGNPIYSFKATTPDGEVWYFGGNGATETTQRNSSTNKIYATGWFLTKVISPSGHEINLSYKAETYSQAQAGGTMYRLLSSEGPAQDIGRTDDLSGSGNGIHTVKLAGITFENGTIQVYSNLTRADLGSSAKMVDTIVISSTGMSKAYHFYYTNTSKTRLRLDSLIGQLEPIGDTGHYKKEKYTFTYTEDPWKPAGNSFLGAQDWWGYYNGYTSNTTIVPAMPDPIDPTVTLTGGIRTPVPSLIAGGTLTKITYPTGGSTVFTFEANRESDYDFGADPYSADNQTTAFSDDNSSIYYNFDANNDNPTHLLHLYSTINPTKKVPLHITAYRQATANNSQDAVSIVLNKQDAQGNFSIRVLDNIQNTDVTVYVDQGYYQFQFKDDKGQTKDPSAANFVKYSVAALWTNKLAIPGFVGHIASGLRIAKIEDYDGVHSTPANVKTYKYLNDNGTSSGYLNYQPVYTYNLTVRGGTNDNPTKNVYYVRTATSNYPLATQHGAVVGYYHVTEYTDSLGRSGKNDYYYTIWGAEGANGNGFPFAPPTTKEWRDGLLVKQVTYKYTGNGTFAPLQQKVLVYSSMNAGAGTSIKAGFNPYPYNYDPSINYLGGCCTTGTVGTLGTMLQQTYTNETDYTYVSSDTTWNFNAQDTTKWVKTWNNYQIDPVTYQLTRVQTLNSRNELLTHSVTYPGSASLSVKGVSNLFGLNIFTYPVEEVTTKSNADGSNARMIKALLTSYKVKKPFRDTVFEARSMVPLTDFKSLAPSGSKDSRYQSVVSFNSYDSFGNIIQEKVVNGPLRSYIWGYTSTQSPYNNTCPIAEVTGADSANIAYTNFESYPTGNSATGYGNWTYSNAATSNDITAPMGSFCYTLSGSNTVTKSGLSSSTKYVISFWAKQGANIQVTGGTITAPHTGMTISGWTYYEYQCSGASAVAIQGTGFIDELRLYPVNTQMSTYTYVPSVGIASKCDVKSLFTYYNYDQAGRLTDIKDQSGKILNHYEYHYQRR